MVRSTTVLVVDGDPDVVDETMATLETVDERVSTVGETTAQAVLDRVDDGDVDCIVSGVRLADTGGLDLLGSLRNDDEDLPFFLLLSDDEDVALGRSDGREATDYIRKRDVADLPALVTNRVRTAVNSHRNSHSANDELERYRTILRRSTDIHSILDRDGRFTFVSQSHVGLLGYEPEHLRGEAAVEYVHPDDRDTVIEAFGRVLEHPENRTSMEFRFRHADGSWRWLEATGRNLTGDPAVEGVIFNARDITDTKERQTELERFETIVLAIPDVIAVVDIDGNNLWINGHQVTGYDRGELIGDPIGKVMTEEDVAMASEVVRDLLASEERERAVFEMDLVTKDGEHIPCETHLALLPADDDGYVPGTVAVLRDISERKERERELRRQNERLDEFASVVSHDLRNPLSIAKGNAELLADDIESPRLDIVGDALDRMDRLVEQLLALARAGSAIGDRTEVAIADAAEEAWEVVQTPDASLAIERTGVVHADRHRLLQLFENVFRNAVEHGGCEVTVSVDVLENGFCIEDDGPGIPGEERETVFESGYSTIEGGTGLGLNIVREIVDAHGWSVTLAEGTAGGVRLEITDADIEIG